MVGEGWPVHLRVKDVGGRAPSVDRIFRQANRRSPKLISGTIDHQLNTDRTGVSLDLTVVTFRESRRWP